MEAAASSQGRRRWLGRWLMSVRPEAIPRGRVWWAAGLLAGALAVNWSIWTEIGHIALNDGEASHILLVPAVAAWLVWVRRATVGKVAWRTSPWGPAVMAGGALLSWVGFEHAVQSFWHGGAVVVLIGALLTAMGWPAFARIWPAVVVLVFLIPVPGTIRQEFSVPLQTMTAWLTHGVYELLAVEVWRHGNVLHYQGEPIAVAEACNGMRMVFVLVLVCYAVAFAQPLRTSVRVAVLVLSPVVALLCNVIRLVPSVWFYGHYPETAGPVFHDLSGWAMVGVAFGLVMGFIWLLKWLELPVMRTS